jgi:hypothetical protein
MTAKQTNATKTPMSEKVRMSSKTDEKKSHVLEVSGLCISCDLAENCMHRTANKSAVQFCEEFTEALNAPIHQLRQAPMHLTPKEEIQIPSGLKGLCVNCDLRGTCLHASAEAGVWQCEEYR